MNKYSRTIGVDLGDKSSALCVLDEGGEILEEAKMPTTRKAVKARFESMKPACIALETGTASRWVSQLLREWGHEVIVADARRLRMIYANENKNDRLDAQALARVARFDPKLFTRVRHRGAQTHVDLEQLKAREVLVKQRKSVITHLRSVVKTFGYVLPKCDTDSFWKKTRAHLPEELQEVLAPLYDVLEVLDRQVREYDRRIQTLCERTYPHTELLRAVTGVGPITALAYVLTIEEPERFAKSRQVGAFFGLRPRLHQSGERDPELPITKCGNGMVRRLLVQAAHYILGPFGPDCDLRRFGTRLAGQGGKRAKKRAVVAVARKLAVLLHRLWSAGEVYDPLWNAKQCAKTVG